MPIFAIITTQGSNESLGKKISSEYENKSYELPNGQWLISYDGTSKQLSDHLGITSDQDNRTYADLSAMVLSTDGYWGFANKSIWEWFKVNSS